LFTNTWVLVKTPSTSKINVVNFGKDVKSDSENEELYDKPRWLVLNKLDMLDEETAQQRIAHLLAAIGWDYPTPDDRFEFDMTTPRLFKISALTHEGTQELVQQINQYISEKKRLMAEAAAAQAQQQPEMDLPETNRDVFQAED